MFNKRELQVCSGKDEMRMHFHTTKKKQDVNYTLNSSNGHLRCNLVFMGPQVVFPSRNALMAFHQSQNLLCLFYNLIF